MRNKVRLIRGLLTLAIGVVVLVGCSSQPMEGIQQNLNVAQREDLVMAIGSEPDGGFDPVIGWGRYGSPLFQSTLVETGPNMEIIMDLATEYEISEDGLTWTFQLREDAYFTDGERVTAGDVAFTFNSAKDSGSIVDLTNLEGISMVNENTVVFELNKSDSSFIYTIAATGIVPAHAYGPNYGETAMGSGPFILIQWDKGQQIIMQANEDYYGNVPEIKRVTILFMGEDVALAAARSGQLDVAITSANLAHQQINGMALEVVKTIDNRGLTLPYLMNEGKTNENGHQLGNDVTSDIAIRRALAYGIDREALVSDVINGFGRPAYTEADGMPWANPEAIVAHDVEKAKSILEEAGWVDKNNDGTRERNGQRAEFNLLYSASDLTRQALANAVSLQAEALGIKITIEGTSWDVIEARMFSEAVLMGWGAQSPIETYLLYHSENMGRDFYNPQYFSNERVDEYIDQAMNSLDIEESMTYWQKVQWDGEAGVATQGESPWVWLVNVDHLYYVREGLNIGTQKIHPHGHAWPLLANLKEWTWK